MASVTLELIKARNGFYGEARRSQRKQIVDEMKVVVRGYLESRLAPNAQNTRWKKNHAQDAHAY